jgi:hypothetical protein
MVNFFTVKFRQGSASVPLFLLEELSMVNFVIRQELKIRLKNITTCYSKAIASPSHGRLAKILSEFLTGWL